MQTEVILEVKYANIFKVQFEYLLKYKNIINCLHIINDSTDQSLSVNFHILKIRHLGWIKVHNCKTSKLEFLNKNFNNKNINYIFISKYICWQSKNIISDCVDKLTNCDEIIVPQIFNSERNIYLHQIFGFLKTFTFRPWDDEYIDSMNQDSWPVEVYHYLHNNYLKLISNDDFEKVKFNKYYFNDKEPKPEYFFFWKGGLANKSWFMSGDLFTSIISPNDTVYNLIAESNYLDKYDQLIKKQFEPIHVQLKFEFIYPDDPKDIIQLTFDFEENNIFNKIIFKKQIIKFAINSNINQSKKILNKLTFSLLKNNIPASNIFVFIGGSDENKKETIDGITYHYVDHNSFDHTALVSIIEEDYESDFWMILHDTCEVGKNFYNNLLNHNKSNFSAVLEDGWLNMGLFSKKFLEDNKNYILYLKNCNKMRAILSEQIYSRFGDRSYINSRARTQLKGKTDVYNDGIERLIIYFADLDLYKYQSYHYNSEYTKELREKYFLDISKLT